MQWARIWVGYVEDRPVTTSLAYRSDGVVGIFCVATTEEARGHGYGEAVTCAAVSSATGVPAVLQASDLGKPVYERMGFRTVNEFTVWEGRRRTSSRR